MIAIFCFIILIHKYDTIIIPWIEIGNLPIQILDDFYRFEFNLAQDRLFGFCREIDSLALAEACLWHSVS
ncbi:hypothetical protein C7B77_20480 [Chamaesiphon polymorphus CCALA 037]|uniref:Uncharacterized protein n=1 Tax=Chamaesiphon polymorphus CCALA 037 TaxID=2107692 RepID=A0A2T1G5H2_9CYAN|nr:hypothetical protein C7B77_20480 [Chamaesiphon polymorphus CCALA 037]